MTQAPTENNELIYTEQLWNKFVAKIEDGFKLKRYPHLDKPFHFPSRKNEILKLISAPDYEPIKHHNFLPFLKILQKNPRLRKTGSQEWKYSYGRFKKKFTYKLKAKTRPICFGSHLDSYVLSFYAFALNEYPSVEQHIAIQAYWI